MTIFWSMDKPLTASEILQHRKEGTWAAIRKKMRKLFPNWKTGWTITAKRVYK